MIFTLTHKTRLQPNLRQESYFKQACGVSRFAWNWGLENWKKHYESGEKTSGFELKKEFNAIKKQSFPWTYDVTKYASQQPFIFLQRAFQNFFNGQSGYPKFKRKGVHDSFYIGNDHIDIKGNKIRIPKLGWVRMRESLRFKGKVQSATISRRADMWFVSIHVELDQIPERSKSQSCAGIDLGVTCLATIFNGSDYLEVEGPKPLKRYLSKLKRAQRKLSRMQMGSKNYEKQRIIVSRIHYKIYCIRQDALHKLTTYLIQEYGKIGIEDLNVKGMMSNHCLARSIADMGFYELRRQLEYKAQLAGVTIQLVDRWYPSSKTCSRCQSLHTNLKLKDRVFECPNCGLRVCRDKNASVNIFSTVSSTGIDACGEESAGSNMC